ncbi:hypothetical protein SLUN_05460 [Streptomyces lunaelactis]|uniref:DUF4873 domain-containing protein n=1 Tax=Streptomyces lunaelactis TaxID=1535768 RepID=A0A2R4SXY4_9ACTN|nr:DUF4873 domain-containing protein [Streptomyces lunaelactis]AVZ71719.1 hypothetical protein SLUN_05460 [Streptomyces lunaelactis]NUJ99968.1 DUF4873 domain-containing protein [Streptomyces lunaelactis]NUK09240.1 DUF4873 domain-containing protein [Streptomyces lunaelactis]NUK16580.1 DUF4873 domain-containing protein [Streptomyces lunaelactis]NUK21895.1 DUF4873 domain-containing protein [Streptomyces lunaelactis]
MSNYQGPATLIAGGAQIEVVATLSGGRSGPGSEWGGSVQTDSAAQDLCSSMNNNEVKLRLPDGREGDVVATSTAIGSGRLKVSGRGPMPF